MEKKFCRGRDTKVLFSQDTEGCVQDSVSTVLWIWGDGKCSMELPEGFQEMEERNKEEIYPYEERPEIILEDFQEDVQITVQFFEKELKEAEVRDALSQVFKLTEESFPEYKTSPEYLWEEAGVPIGWFLLTMEDLEKEHVKAVFSLEERMMLFTLTYPVENNFKWRPLFKYIFSTIKKAGKRMEGLR
ncbi:MAG: hypothetical protein K2P76_01290 [Lachnospiraceae bacterium]|nr:hypothetical protein [Lachnospiraceae bacterium]